MKLRDKRLDIVVSIVRAFSVFFFQLLENAVKRLVGWIKSSYDISHALLYNLCEAKFVTFGTRNEHAKIHSMGTNNQKLLLFIDIHEIYSCQLKRKHSNKNKDVLSSLHPTSLFVENGNWGTCVRVGVAHIIFDKRRRTREL